MRTGHRMGPAGAPVGILLYTVYECSSCREFEAVLQQARRRYPDHLAVTVKLFTSLQDEHIDLYLAAECAAVQGVFEPFHAAALRIESPVGGVASWELVMDSVPIPDPFTFFVNGMTPHVGSLSLGALDSILVAALPSRAAIDR